MINWRNGKAGFVGNIRYAIKGVFQFAYSLTSENITTPDIGFGIISKISPVALGLLSKVSGVDVGLTSEIELNAGVISRISNPESGVESLMS